MAGRFMKIKKIVIPFITLVIMTSQLAGCATMNSDEMLKSMNESPDVSIEYAVPDTGQQSLDATQVIDVGDQQYVSDSNLDGDVGLIADQENQEKEPLSGDQLTKYFQLTYDSCTAFDSSSQEEQIAFELDMLVSFCDTDGEKLPADYAKQYREWRSVETEKIPGDNTEAKTHDTPEKTTPPAAKPSTSGNNQQKPADNQQQDQGSTNGSYDPDADAWNPYEGMTPEEREAQIKADQEATQKIVDGDTGSFG